MDVRDQVIEALRQNLGCEFVLLEDDDGITGVAVSRRFEGASALDRQAMIEDALAKAPRPLRREDARRVLLIAAMTPSEYNSVGAKIRVHRVKPIANGVEVLVRGGVSDAEYVRGALNNVKGVKTSSPAQSPGAVGILMTFKAQGSKTDPLTKQRAVKALQQDPYIEVMEGV